MFHKVRCSLGSWAGLAVVAGLLALGLVLLGSQVTAEDGAPAGWPAWKVEAVFGAGDSVPRSPTEQGDWDGFRVNNPCVISGTMGYGMWYNGQNPSSPGYGVQIGAAGSPDGTTWTKNLGNPVLGVGAPGEWDDMYRGQMACMEDGGTFKMWYSGASTGPWQTGYATSSDGVTWNVYAGNPVLPVGPAGSWDEIEADGPTVLKDGAIYKMWYHGCDASYTCSIGYATSSDGIAWIKYAENPVLEGTAGEWDEGFVAWPRVIKNGSTYEMWYHNGGQIGFATSPDGIDWTKYAGNPVLTETWDGGGAGISSLLLEGSTYKMWLSGGTGASQGIGYATSSDGIDWTMYGANPVLTPGDRGLVATVNYDHDGAEVRTLPDLTVAITVADGGGVKATTSGQTDGDGFFNTWDAEWDPERPDIMPGDTVLASADGLTTTVDPVGSLDVTVDYDGDLVAGTVHAPWFAPQTLRVRCDVWTEEGGPRLEVLGVAADGGSFTCDYGAIGYDLEGGQDVAVRYYEPDGDNVIGMALPLQPFFTADYGDDWVQGRYEAGHTVWITVTESSGTTVKATAEVVSQEYPGWGGWTGFAAHDDWVPARPDIVPGDWVDVLVVDNGYGNRVQVGLIDGQSNVETDLVSGTIHADWLSPYTVTVSCEIHEENGPGIQVEGVDPDGGSFECDFAGMWDILPGHNVAVNYIEPDSDRVQAHFREPVPDLQMEKWAEGSGQAAPDSHLVYTLRYRNQGDATAETIVLTDTLPANTAYVDDSSGETPTVDGDEVIWTLGPLDPEEQEQFYLVLSNTAGPGDTLTNMADVYTDYDSDEGNNHAESDVQVADGQPDLYVDKHRAGDHPVPGETMLYEINYGNNNAVASGPVELTDTLPAYTTVLDWWSQNGYDLWQEQSRNGQLVLTAPSIPGYWGDTLYLRVQVDPATPLDTELVNRVEIYTDGDGDPDNDWSERYDWTGEPYANVGVDKRFDWGTIVPGGEGDYWLQVRNHGNVAASVVLTETLPAGTSFLHARLYTAGTEVPFPPDYVDDEVAVWDLGLMEPGDWYQLGVHLGYDSDLEPGTVLENCAMVTMDEQDTWRFDDESCAEVRINPTGPNVRVHKWAWWNWEGRLQYEIRFDNLGTTRLEDVEITDTLPEGTTFSGSWWHNFWEEVQFSQSGNQLSWTLSRLEPGWSSSVFFEADLDGGLIGEQGLAFTNTVEAPITGDVFPADNVHELVTYTGPDLYAEKWLSEGELMPGQRITLTVQCGNLSQGPWGVSDEASVRLRDRLPTGMTYVAAYWPDGNLNEYLDYDEENGVVVWEFGSLGSGEDRTFYLVLDLDEEIDLGRHINRLEIYEVPDDLDIDPVPGNNTFDYPLIIGKQIYLPIVLKNR